MKPASHLSLAADFRPRHEALGCQRLGNDARDSSLYPPQVFCVLLFHLAGDAYPLILKDPYTTIVTKRLAHKRKLRLIVARHWDTGRVYLCHTGVSKESSTFVALPSR